MVRHRRSVLLALALCLTAVSAGAIAGGEPSGEAPVPSRLHDDPSALERALLDAMQALSKGDGTALRAGLDGMEKACRRAGREDAIPKEVYQFDLAFHATLDRARELAGAGDVEKASQQFCWIQNACRKCHDAARKGATLP